MATAIPLQAGSVRTRTGNRFFIGVAVVMLVVISLGFGKSFFLRPVFSDTPLPIHLVVHGVTMTAWYLLFLIQACLVHAGRIGLHRSLGVAGLLLGAGVVVTGVQVQFSAFPRMQAIGMLSTPEGMAAAVGFTLMGLAGLFAFAVVLVLAIALRRRPATHKRLMFWAAVLALGPAFASSRPLGQWLDSLVAPLLPFFPSDLLWFVVLMAYDWRTLRRFHPATYLGFAALAFYLIVVTDWMVRNEALRAYITASMRG